uniref:Uncharacterized protein n=1 Tax=Zea mays TaxID=4577 RepID=A0A804MWS3_MAIZE
MSALTARSSSAASTKLPLLLSTSMATATPMAATSVNAFRCCSAYSGQGTMGTPNHRLSRTEFQPQCVTKPPTAACARTSFCGTAAGHTSPLPRVRSTNPSGRSSARSASTGLHVPGAGGPRSTQRKRWPLRSRPRATSRACAAPKNPLLPKQRRTTDAAGCVSSHRTHGCGGSVGGANETTGPTGYSAGAAGQPAPRLAMAESTPGSSSAAVLTRMPSASANRLPWYAYHLHSGSSLRMIGVGRASGGTGGSPGMSAAPSMSPNSPATSSHIAGRRRKKESAAALQVKYTYAGGGTAGATRSRATSSSGVQKRSSSSAATGHARPATAALTCGACSSTTREMNSTGPAHPAGASTPGRRWKRTSRPAAASSARRMTLSSPRASCSVGGRMTSTVTESARPPPTLPSSRLPASSMGMRWPAPQTGSKTTVGVAISISGAHAVKLQEAIRVVRGRKRRKAQTGKKRSSSSSSTGREMQQSTGTKRSGGEGARRKAGGPRQSPPTLGG